MLLVDTFILRKVWVNEYRERARSRTTFFSTKSLRPKNDTAPKEETERTCFDHIARHPCVDRLVLHRSS
jgi:hypothetical protein